MEFVCRFATNVKIKTKVVPVTLVMNDKCLFAEIRRICHMSITNVGVGVSTHHFVSLHETQRRT
mgnify:CR=1 FL=1